LNNQKASRIVPPMKRTLLYALLVVSALPVFAQSTEFGAIVGGSRRFVEGAPREESVEFDDSTFSFSNTTFDMYWAFAIEPETFIKIKGGRIEGPVAVAYEVPGDDDLFRRDVDGEVQHVEMNVEYRFTEPFGTTGLFAGLGFYRVSADGEDADTNYGFNAGVNADFPLSPRYGIVLEGTYHWSKAAFQQRFMTFGGGLRVRF
jgi:hypothetical protein